MDTCDKCGDSTDHAFKCSYCERRFCGEHRLPEKHECPAFAVGGEISSFGGEGPEVSDRRSTWRKRIERVREKEDNPAEPDPVAPKKRSAQADDAELEILTCPTCATKTDEITECGDCGMSVCSSCEQPREHECSTAITDDDGGDNSDGDTVFSRILNLFR